MGLDHYDIAPDDRGGRPEEEEEDYSRTPMGEEPLTTENDTESFWEKILDRFVTGDKPDDDELAQISHYCSILPRTARNKLEEHGFCEFGETKEPIDPDMSEQTTSDITKGGSDSGFAAIINDAKE